MRAFCSSVPATTTGLRPKMLRCTADAPLKAAPDSAMACIITDASVMPRPGSAVLLGHRDAEPPPLDDRTEELLRKPAVVVALVPVLRPEVLAEASDRLADGALLLAQRDSRAVRGHRRRYVAHSSVSLSGGNPDTESTVSEARTRARRRAITRAGRPTFAAPPDAPFSIAASASAKSE